MTILDQPEPTSSRTPETPFIVGIGGTPNPTSSSEAALRAALIAAERVGCRTRLFGGEDLCALPHYGTGDRNGPVARDLVSSIRQADGLLVASPAYHGTVSGLVKNAFDYIEETAKDVRVYLDGVPVGLIVTAFGAQALGSTLGSLRSIVHALRGWPTPYGLCINTSTTAVIMGGRLEDGMSAQIDRLVSQVVDFAKHAGRAAYERSAA